MSLIALGQITIEEKPRVCGVPRGVTVEYFGALLNGTRFVIMRPTENWEYTDFVCLMEDEAEQLQPVSVKEVTRYRDGGTTIVVTEKGTFNFPTQLDPNGKPTFAEQPLSLFEV